MNIQEYISSGIVESYVLGLASGEERQTFEKMCAQYPEVLQAREAFELLIERQAMDNAIAPDGELKNKILARIHSEDKVVPIYTAPVKRINWWKFAAAACLLLLAGSVYLNIYLANSNTRLSGDKKIIENKYENTLAELDTMKKDMQVLQQNPNVKMAQMKGMDVSPQSYATVYWDTVTHDVYLMVNNLPVPASDKQYQLWALLDGKPVDLGVFDVKKEKLLIQAKNTRGAQAFAITLEKKGGSPSPQGVMYVKGDL